MEPINIEATEDTPTISYDESSNTFCISGKSLPEDSIEFYTPIAGWIKEFLPQSSGTTFQFKLIYSNTSSAKQIFKLLTLIRDNNDESAVIEWHYESGDDDMKRAGEKYGTLLNVPISLVEY